MFVGRGEFRILFWGQLEPEPDFCAWENLTIVLKLRKMKTEEESIFLICIISQQRGNFYITVAVALKSLE